MKKGAVDTVDKILSSLGLNTDTILNDARDRRADELAQNYFRGDPDVTTLVNDLLTAAGTSMNALMADATAANLEYIDRVDRMTAIAESRRDASLREIDRRRAVLGETLRRSLQQIEHEEPEASRKGEKAV
jgi:hypothetical protein